MTVPVVHTLGYLVAGGSAVALALGPPLHDAAEELFAAHMVQHLVLVTVAAPLLAAGLPDLTLLGRLPRGARQIMGRWVRRLRRLLPRAGEGAPALALVWLLHVTVLWVWHAPALYEAALRQPVLHAIEHGTLLGSAIAFWAVVRSRGRHRAPGRIGALLYLFTGAAQSTALGALLTLTSEPSYAIHAGTVERWGLTPLADQQAAGLIMWVVGGLGYVLVALLVLARILRPEEPR